MNLKSKIKMKVLLVNKFFYLRGGSERVFFDERAGLQRAGVTVADFSMADPANRPSPDSGYFIPPVDYHAGGRPWERLRDAVGFIHSREAVRRIRALVADFRPDIAHLHNIYHQLTPAIIPALKAEGVRVVLTLHDGKLVCPAYLMLDHGRICVACRGKRFDRALRRHCQGSWGRELLLAAEGCWHRFRGSYEGVDRFLVPSRFLADLLVENLPWLDRSKVSVLPNGVDPALFTTPAEDEGYALYLGRLSREKGVETLLAAHARMSGRLPLKVVGTGPLADDLRRRHPAAAFPGYQSGPALIDTVRRAGFLVIPSEWYENAPMAVIEAMALGKPTVGAAVGGIPELIDDGKTGLLFEMGDVDALADRMTVLAESPERRRRMGAAARRRAKRWFGADTHRQRLLEIYQSLN